MITDADVVVVGGGLAGLGTAVRLHRAGLVTVVCEAGEEVGGRVRTDRRDGFVLDRGFQVVLPAYPSSAGCQAWARCGCGRSCAGCLPRRTPDAPGWPPRGTAPGPLPARPASWAAGLVTAWRWPRCHCGTCSRPAR